MGHTSVTSQSHPRRGGVRIVTECLRRSERCGYPFYSARTSLAATPTSLRTCSSCSAHVRATRACVRCVSHHWLKSHGVSAMPNLVLTKRTQPMPRSRKKRRTSKSTVPPLPPSRPRRKRVATSRGARTARLPSSRRIERWLRVALTIWRRVGKFILD
jgi:hypothetical protein